MPVRESTYSRTTGIRREVQAVFGLINKRRRRYQYHQHILQLCADHSVIFFYLLCQGYWLSLNFGAYSWLIYSEFILLCLSVFCARIAMFSFNVTCLSRSLRCRPKVPLHSSFNLWRLHKSLVSDLLWLHNVCIAFKITFFTYLIIIISLFILEAFSPNLKLP